MWENPIWPIEWSCRSLAWLSLVLDGLPPCFYEDHRHRKGYFGKLFWASSSGCSYLRCSTVSNCWQNNGAVLDLCAQRAKSTNGLVGGTWNFSEMGFLVFLSPAFKLWMLLTTEQKNLPLLHTSNLTCFSAINLLCVGKIANRHLRCLQVSVRMTFCAFQNTLRELRPLGIWWLLSVFSQLHPCCS